MARRYYPTELTESELLKEVPRSEGHESKWLKVIRGEIETAQAALPQEYRKGWTLYSPDHYYRNATINALDYSLSDRSSEISKMYPETTPKHD